MPGLTQEAARYRLLRLGLLHSAFGTAFSSAPTLPVQRALHSSCYRAMYHMQPVSICKSVHQDLVTASDRTQVVVVLFRKKSPKTDCRRESS